MSEITEELKKADRGALRMVRVDGRLVEHYVGCVGGLDVPR